MHMTREFRSAILLAGVLQLGPLRAVYAQSTGVLSTAPEESQARAEGLIGQPLEDRITPEANRAVVLYDPLFASPMRSSANGLNVVFVDSLQEGRIQLNVCDLKVKWCNVGSFLLMLAGPLNDKKATDLASLDGLLGKTRIELAVTPNILGSDVKQAKGGFLIPNITISAVVSHPEFSFRSTSTLAEEEMRRWAYRAYIGPRWRAENLSLLVGYAYERNFDEQEQQSVCTPASFGPTGTTVCSDVVVGAPVEEKAHNLRAELKVALAGKFAVGGEFKFDFTNDAYALDVPLYFLTTTTEGLAGGARLGFRTGKSAPSITFFINAFKL